MKSDKLKRKRVRHCYPRQELYHRFIHDDTMMYYESTNRCSCSCIGNVFCIGTTAKYATIKDMQVNNLYFQDRAVAVIDRKYKRILISTKYNYHWYSVRKAVPKDYEIFYTDSVIPCYDILCRNKRDLLFKIHAEYLVKNFCTSLVQAYAILQDKVKVTSFEFKYIFSEDNRNYKSIVDFVHKYNLYNRKWYKKQLFPKYENYIYRGWSTQVSIKFETPSLKNIIENTVFNQEERIKIEQVKFYSDYCYGYGIPLKDVVKNWNRTDWDRKLIAKYNRSNVTWNAEDYPTFNQFIEQTTIIINQVRNNQIRTWQEQSEENYHKAKEELDKYNSSQQTVTDWRENKNYHNSSYRVSYRRYILPKNKNDMGCWTTDYVSNFGGIKFANTQLKLVNDEIITSKHARVPLSDAIRIFKLFQRWMMSDGGESINFLNGKKIGIYSIRYVKFMEKITDNNTRLGKQEWVFVIGCHHLWLDDIIDFIHYYNLENEFDLI